MNNTKISRRTLAWTTPVVLAVASAPMVAASPACGTYAQTQQNLAFSTTQTALNADSTAISASWTVDGYLPAGTVITVWVALATTDPTDVPATPNVAGVVSGKRDFDTLFSTDIGPAMDPNDSGSTDANGNEIWWISRAITFTSLVDLYPSDGPVSATITSPLLAHSTMTDWSNVTPYYPQLPDPAVVTDDSTCTQVTVVPSNGGEGGS